VHDVPGTVQRLFDYIDARTRRVRDLGTGRVIECADAQVATLLEQDRSLRSLCRRWGERHLLLDPASESRPGPPELTAPRLTVDY
jgi:hypothetical protein